MSQSFIYPALIHHIHLCFAGIYQIEKAVLCSEQSAGTVYYRLKNAGDIKPRDQSERGFVQSLQVFILAVQQLISADMFFEFLFQQQTLLICLTDKLVKSVAQSCYFRVPSTVNNR